MLDSYKLIWTFLCSGFARMLSESNACLTRLVILQASTPNFASHNTLHAILILVQRTPQTRSALLFIPSKPWYYPWVSGYALRRTVRACQMSAMDIDLLFYKGSYAIWVLHLPLTLTNSYITELFNICIVYFFSLRIFLRCWLNYNVILPNP